MSFGKLVLAMVSSFLVMIIIGVVVFILLKQGVLSGKGKSTVGRSIETSGPTRFCTVCGASNPEENHFCDKCGAELGD